MSQPEPDLNPDSRTVYDQLAAADLESGDIIIWGHSTLTVSYRHADTDDVSVYAVQPCGDEQVVDDRLVLNHHDETVHIEYRSLNRRRESVDVEWEQVPANADIQIDHPAPGGVDLDGAVSGTGVRK